MDAIKLIPQAFFDFLARLVPGFVALTLWFSLFGGHKRWPDIIESVVAVQELKEPAGVGLIMAIAVPAAFVIGQLVAPFGKAFQRVAELAEKILRSDITGYFDAVHKGWRKWFEQKSIEEPGYYDWLRANHPQSGELVAKIRAESTMFYALASVFAAALVLDWCGLDPEPITHRLRWLLVLLLVSCWFRGWSVSVTKAETEQKLWIAHAHPKKRPKKPPSQDS